MRNMKGSLLVICIMAQLMCAQPNTFYYTQNGKQPIFQNSTVARYLFSQNQEKVPPNVKEIQNNIQIQVTNQDVNILDIQIKPAKKSSKIYEFIEMEPYTSLFNETINEVKNEKAYLYKTEVINNGVKVTRKDTNEVIFDTSPFSFLLNQVYLEVSTIIPTQNIFGLGERNYKHLRYPPGVYTLYGRDEPSVIEAGQSGGNVYSSHPMYLMREKSGKFHVVFLKNSAGLEVKITTTSITFYAIGGIGHFKIFLGDSNPETAIKMYHKYLGGGYIIPPFWSLGYHQSRWGYKSGQELNNVVDHHIQNGLPLDTIWSDIDYFKNSKTFSINSQSYRNQDFDQLKKKQVRFIGIIDSAIGQDQSIGGLPNIEAYDAFCRSPTSGQYFKGNQWAGDSYFIDFFNPNSEKLFEQGILEMERHLNKIDGIWLDMNEPANFCNGECNWYSSHSNEGKAEYKSPPFTFPYVIGTRDLQTKTLPPHLIHFGGNFHKDVHNLYGMQETYVTNNILKKRYAQPFILTRSSFAGTGKFSFKWSGDNVSNYEFLQTSLTSQILFNFFGIPMVGSDICGFAGNTTPELCMRWVQLGVTYPFARNHNVDTGKSQELYVLGDQVLKCAKKNLRFRYSILKHLYALFIKSERTGTIQRPLFFEFPDCEDCYLDDVLDYQFMMGKELLFTPVLLERVDTIKPLFPQGDWYDLLTGMLLSSSSSNQGKRRRIQNPLDAVVPVFLRDGYGIARQDTKDVLNTSHLSNMFYLVSALRETSEEELAKKKYASLYTSKITMLDLDKEQYFNEQHVEDECMTNKECVFKIHLSIGKDLNNNFTFQLSTSRKVKSQIAFKQLILYGVPSHLYSLISQCEINKSYLFKITKLSTKGSFELNFTQSIQISQINDLNLCFRHA